MAQISLYRKYRPQTFADVAGQEHVTRTLRNALAEGTVAHAYLFTGARGTGKTTTARIFAKALQCEHGPTPDPDGDCEQCVAIVEGTHPDVYELDAASRTQVEVVREEIINRLQYPPVRGAWKLYIIDEVHMLSTHSFNALLKSIEEPPARTVFILCTTHPHKVPETIHSRCQRFDFHRIGIDDIVRRLDYIARAEGFEVADGALALVARHAAGGMRDAISTLEQLAAYSGRSISLEDVEGLLGEVDSALIFEVAGLIAQRDVAGSLRFVARITQMGVDMPEFVRQLVGHVRDLYVIAAVGDADGIVVAPSSDLARLTAQAHEFGLDRLSRVLDLLGELTGDMRWSPDPRLALEVALTRLARPHGELTLEALAERVEALEAGAPVSAVSTVSHAEASAPPLIASDAAPTPALALTPTPAHAPSCPGTAGTFDRARAKRAWPAIVAEVRKRKPARSAMFDGTEVDIDADGETLVVEFPSAARFPMSQASEPESIELLKGAMTTVLGPPPPFRFQLGRGAVRPPEMPTSAQPREATRANSGSSPDIETLMTETLGAQKVSETSHTDK